MEEQQKLIDMCIDIFAHSECDFEWTNSKGNGINSSEASGVAMDVIKILGIDYDDDLERKISESAKMLEKAHGY